MSRTPEEVEAQIKGLETRKLTDEEFEFYNKQSVIICGVKIPLKVTRD